MVHDLKTRLSHKRRIRSGFTLTEVMISILIIMVLATGAMGYQYNSTRDVKISEVQAGATRIAMLLLESWKGQQGDTSFDPVGVFGGDMALQTSTVGPAAPDSVSLTLLDSYEMSLAGVYYYITLSYGQDTVAEPMVLNATVAWRRDYIQGTLHGNEQRVCYSTYVVRY